jgi:hypothetical protein
MDGLVPDEDQCPFVRVTIVSWFFCFLFSSSFNFIFVFFFTI